MNPKKPRKKCITCGKEVKRAKAVYCSSQCMADHTKAKKVEEWKEDPNTATIVGGLSRTIRHFLLKEADNKCQNCGFEGYNSVTGNSILEVDHIDGNCDNNTPENLRVICPNCHAMSPNYKALNKGSGRKYRIKYK